MLPNSTAPTPRSPVKRATQVLTATGSLYLTYEAPIPKQYRGEPSTDRRSLSITRVGRYSTRRDLPIGISSGGNKHRGRSGTRYTGQIQIQMLPLLQLHLYLCPYPYLASLLVMVVVLLMISLLLAITGTSYASCAAMPVPSSYAMHGCFAFSPTGRRRRRIPTPPGKANTRALPKKEESKKKVRRRSSPFQQQSFAYYEVRTPVQLITLQRLYGYPRNGLVDHSSHEDLYATQE